MTEMQTEAMGPGVAWKGKDTWVSWRCPRLQVLFVLQVGTSPTRMHNDSYIREQNIKGIPKSWGCSLLEKFEDKKSKKTGKMDEKSRVPSVLNLNKSLKDYESSVVFTVDPLHV